jgi:hypothetical protein
MWLLAEKIRPRRPDLDGELVSRLVLIARDLGAC